MRHFDPKYIKKLEENAAKTGAVLQKDVLGEISPWGAICKCGNRFWPNAPCDCYRIKQRVKNKKPRIIGSKPRLRTKFRKVSKSQVHLLNLEQSVNEAFWTGLKKSKKKGYEP